MHPSYRNRMPKTCCGTCIFCEFDSKSHSRVCLNVNNVDEKSRYPHWSFVSAYGLCDFYKSNNISTNGY